MAGPLAGIRIVELAGLGAAPFAGMMLADHGAEVIRVERPGTRADPTDILARSRRRVMIDLKAAEGVALVRALCAKADGLIEGFRPGVMERLGLGPEVLLGDNERLVYGRMTGWGQDGPLAQAAGHDINYIALSGLLHTVGPAGERPVPPVNFAGDFGGGGMMLAFGMAAALLAVRMGQPGQVVDAAMVEGSALLTAMLWQLKAAGLWRDERGANLLDGGAHFYGTYECADGKFVALGSIEPAFYARLREALGLADDPGFDSHWEPAGWPKLRQRLEAIFRTRTRAEWCERMEGSDICFAPVLSLGEAPGHPHNRARGTFVEVAGLAQPAPAPRFSGAEREEVRGVATPGADTEAVLREMDVEEGRIAALREAGVVA